MGFKVLLRAAPGNFRTKLDSTFDEEPVMLLAPEDVDWADRSAAEQCFKSVSPSVFVNYFADTLENEAQALGNISALCQAKRIPLIHFSNYHVFGRVSPGEELAEDADPAPKDSRSKRLLELEKIAAGNKKHIILRVSWLIGGEHENLLQVLIPKLVSGEPIFVSDHDYGRPVTVNFLSNVVVALTQQLLCGAQNWGAFHIHGSDKCSEAEFCDALVRLLKSELGGEFEMPLVAGVDDDRRLLSGNAMLAGNRCTDNFGIQLKSWRNGLKTNVKKYLLAQRLIEK